MPLDQVILGVEEKQGRPVLVCGQLFHMGGGTRWETLQRTQNILRT